MIPRPPLRIQGRMKKGMDPAIINERDDWILTQMEAGARAADVAAALGISETTVSYNRYNRKPRSERKRPAVDLPIGRNFPYQFRAALSDDVKQWLIDNCPKEVRMSQFVASIVVDAYAEETQGDDV